MRPLRRKSIQTDASSITRRVEALERRFSGPELEYLSTSFSDPGIINAGNSLQLPMDDDEFPVGQYPSATNPLTGNPTGYSIVDDYIQCNTFGKDGFWHLFAGYSVIGNAPDAANLNQVRLTIDMELWDEDDVLVGGFNSLWMLEGVDNRSNPPGDSALYRTQAMFYNGGVSAGNRARFKATVSNNSAANITGATGTAFTLIRYGNAFGQVTGEPS